MIPKVITHMAANFISSYIEVLCIPTYSKNIKFSNNNFLLVIYK